MAGWIDPRPNDFSIEGLRARFKSLQDWLRNPEFTNGINLGDGTEPTYDSSTGITVQPPLEAVDALTIRRGSVPSVDELPDPPDPDGPKVVYLTTEQKLYHLKDGTWTAELVASDMVGELDPSTIPADAITADKIADFAVTARKFNTSTHIIY